MKQPLFQHRMNLEDVRDNPGRLQHIHALAHLIAAWEAERASSGLRERHDHIRPHAEHEAASTLPQAVVVGPPRSTTANEWDTVGTWGLL